MPFRALVGHRRLLGLLSRSIAGASLPPSLIFSGPEGVGKRAAALAVAEALNCSSPVAESESGLVLDACGSCPACGRIARGTHPTQTIAPGESGSIKIEQVRDVIDRAEYRPFEGRRRVVVIDEADALMPAAQNALLKTLEEEAVGVHPDRAKADTLLATVRQALPAVRTLTAGEVSRCWCATAGMASGRAPSRRLPTARLVGAGAGVWLRGARDRRRLAADAAASAGDADVRAMPEAVKPLTANTAGRARPPHGPGAGGLPPAGVVVAVQRRRSATGRKTAAAGTDRNRIDHPANRLTGHGRSSDGAIGKTGSNVSEDRPMAGASA
jgi:hypothetical protein